jgi:hypothetical protein
LLAITSSAKLARKLFSEYILNKKKATKAEPKRPPIYEKYASILSKLRKYSVFLLDFLNNIRAYVPSVT